MKGQASFEYLAIVGVILVAIIPIFYYVSQQSNQNIKINQANDLVNTLVKGADTVYALGPGAKTFVWITIPGGVQSITIGGAGNKEINMKMSLLGGTSDIHASSRASLQEGTDGVEPEGIPENRGTYKVAIEMLDTNVVKIGE